MIGSQAADFFEGMMPVWCRLTQCLSPGSITALSAAILNTA
jgi:hypothetical protein